MDLNELLHAHQVSVMQASAAGDDRGRTTFTLNASNGKICDGDYTYGPYIHNSMVGLKAEHKDAVSWQNY